MKAIIVDDEPQARKLLTILLRQHCPAVEVVAECEDLPNGVKAIRKQKPDLVFLDIEMPGHSGLELLDFFNEDEVDFGIIFTTAYNQYALKAFKLSAVDYLLKPVDTEELVAAVARFERSLQKSAAPVQPVASPPQKLGVPVGQSIRFVDTDTIVYLKAENTYTEMMTTEGKGILVSRSLKHFEEALADNPNFFRCHKSFIINKQHVVDYIRSDGGYLQLRPKHIIPVSRNRVDELLQSMSHLM